ncbi:hypothetical protein AQUCO_00500543v1 [Aquilegia coerulea]|uniref:TF-B3 domain-containing protein n=1 Tax=Aquilegia coerulea TaxID=218851 RepID=A0A2G5ESD8_AQUCA|nr:hypothetical protein AQUCO_00500543v1 [Aquilegia coerulea]
MGLTLTQDDQLCDSKEPKFDKEYHVDDQKEREDEVSLEILGEDWCKTGAPLRNEVFNEGKKLETSIVYKERKIELSVSKDACSTDEEVVSVSKDADSSDEDVVSVSKDADSSDEEVELSSNKDAESTDAEVDLSVSIDADSSDEEVRFKVSKDANSTDEKVDSTDEEVGLSISEDVDSTDEEVELSASEDTDSTYEVNGLSVSKDVNSTDDEVEIGSSEDADSTNDEVQLYSSKHANSTDKEVQLHGFEGRTRSYHRAESSPQVATNYRNFSGSKRKPVTMQATGQSTNAASGFKSKYPSFIVHLGRAYVNGGYLYIQMDFADKYLPKRSTNACILDSSERTWSVGYNYKKHRTYFSKHLEGRRACFNRGWKEVVVANELKEGYVCAFELIDEKNVKLKISILSEKVIK